MRDEPRPRRRLPVRPLTVAALALVLLPTGRAPAGPGDGEPPSRVPLRAGEAPTPPPADAAPADLECAAAHAPAPVAALYRSLARLDPEAVPPCEEPALKRIADFLKGPAGGLPLPQKLRAAEVALESVLRFHLSVREHPLTGTDLWADLGARLRRELLDVRIRRLRAAALGARGEGGWGAALTLAVTLARTYPGDAAVRLEAARVRTGYAGDRFLAGDYAAARAQLEWIDAHYPAAPRFPPPRVRWLWRPGVEAVRAALVHKAQALLDEARGLKDDKEALATLARARAVWPALPGLQDDWLKRQKAYPILYVGVRALPESLSPATARTDPERQAVELLFEALVQCRYDDARGERFVPQLAAAAPEVTPGGRRFHLARAAYWSDGERVTSTAVRDTVQLLKALPAWAPSWGDLVEDPEQTDPFRIDFKFRQPFFAPLLPLTFKVLPQNLRKADDADFARAPVGSGPYRYLGRRQEDGRTFAVFAANPYYHRGPERPVIREVRFYVSNDPARDFRDPAQPLHLLLDLPSAKVRPLRQAGVKDVRTLRNRRVWFLALNHRVPALADQNVRRAFAHALDREKILTERFRGGEPAHRLLGVTGGVAAVATLDLRRDVHPEFHRAVNGPYPPGSWACCPPPQVPADLFDPDRARTFAREAKTKVPAVTLKLIYPGDDPEAAEACRDIADQLERLGAGVGWPVRITPEGLPPRQLSEALEQRKYELAYHHLDHASEAYWIWPLFDGRPEALAAGGANFLGCEDAALEGLFRTAMGQRNFAEVRKLTHEIHAHLYERMPLVPLWQLDTHVALHPALRPTRFDPLLVFDDVAEWKLGQ